MESLATILYPLSKLMEKAKSPPREKVGADVANHKGYNTSVRLQTLSVNGVGVSILE